MGQFALPASYFETNFPLEILPAALASGDRQHDGALIYSLGGGFELRSTVSGGIIFDIREVQAPYRPIGDLIFQISKIHMPVSDAVAFAQDDDITGFVTELFSGNDKITVNSTGVSEVWEGYAGDDRIVAVDGIHNAIFVGDGGNDTFIFQGPFDSTDSVDGGSGTNTLALEESSGSPLVLTAAMMTGIQKLDLFDGGNWDVTTVDANVAAGASLLVNGARIGAAFHLDFDGSAETDGRFLLKGGAGDDHLVAGAGDDRLRGGPGADVLTGGAGHNLFIYPVASDSTGPGYDTITDFNAGLDRVLLGFAVTGIDPSVTSGALSSVSFDADLGAALGGSQLGAHHAVLFTASAGSLVGHTFLVVDADGAAGYQSGDLVIDVTGSPDLALRLSHFIT